MAITNFPQGVSSFGVPLAGSGIPTAGTADNYWFVNSATGGPSGPGTVDQPFDSIAHACSTTYNVGLGSSDVIIVSPEHTETVTAASGLTISTAGVQVIGLGTGNARPTVTFNTVVGATMLISGANVKVDNIICKAGINNLTCPIQVTGASPTLNIEWQDVSGSYEAISCILLTTVSNAKINLRYRGVEGSAVCVNPVQISVCTGVRLNIDFTGTASTAVVNAVGGSASKDVVITGYIYNSGTTTGAKDFVDSSVGTSTEYFISVFDGSAGFNYIGGSASAPILDSTVAAENALYGAYPNGITWQTSHAHATGYSVQSVLGFVQDAVNNGTGGSTPGTNKSVIDAIGANGVSQLTVGAGTLSGAPGANFIVQKSVTSSLIVSSGAIDLTQIATTGDILVRNFTMETDSTGLASQTANAYITITKTGGHGATTLGTQIVTALGANITMQGSSMATTAMNLPFTIEAGSKLQIAAATYNCTGAGTIKFTMQCQRVTAGAILTNA